MGTSGAKSQAARSLSVMPSTQQTDLLQEAGIEPRAAQPGLGLAIKSDLQLPWNQLRKLKAWLATSGLKLESEHALRKTLATSLPVYEAKELPMVTKSGEILMTPTVYLPNLLEVISHYLALYESANLLHSHDGTIPDDEIWIKLGGDHGGGSFKFVMQVSSLIKKGTAGDLMKTV